MKRLQIGCWAARRLGNCLHLRPFGCYRSIGTAQSASQLHSQRSPNYAVQHRLTRFTAVVPSITSSSLFPRQSSSSSFSTSSSSTVPLSPPPSSSSPSSVSAAYAALPPKKKRRLRIVFFLLVSSFVTGVIFNLQDEDQRSLQLGVLKSLPLNLLSRLWGEFNRFTLPTVLRAPVYKLWTAVFHCNLDEAGSPLEDYQNLSQFFSRQLKAGVRPLESDDMIAPVDGQITVIGTVGRNGKVEQIKGSSYSIGEFLGFIPDLLNEFPPSHQSDSSNSSSSVDPPSLHYIVFYLAPGDYHRIHNPCFSLYHHRRHFPGHLYPVNPLVLRYVPSLFIRNERVVLVGRWRTDQESSHTAGDRFFSMSMVGALNVGSVKLSYDEALVTNQRHHYRHREKRLKPQLQTPQMDITGEKQYDSELLSITADGLSQYIKLYGKGQIESGEIREVGENGITQVESREDVNGLRVKKGEEVARFELGSTVVLVFETLQGEEWEWKVKEGQTIKMGQAIGTIIKTPIPQK